MSTLGAYLEAWTPDGIRLVPLGDDRLTIGRSEDNGLALPQEPLVSRLHAPALRAGSGTGTKVHPWLCAFRSTSWINCSCSMDGCSAGHWRSAKRPCGSLIRQICAPLMPPAFASHSMLGRSPATSQFESTLVISEISRMAALSRPAVPICRHMLG